MDTSDWASETRILLGLGGLRLGLDFSAAPSLARRERTYYQGFLAAGRPDAVLAVREAHLAPGPALPPAPGETIAAYLASAYGRFPPSPPDAVADAVSRALEWLRLLTGNPWVLSLLEGLTAASLAAAVLHPRPGGFLLLGSEQAPDAVVLNGVMKEREKTAFLRESVYLCLSVLLARSGGLLLHGTGLERNGLGYAFLGLSGAGKSTLARLAGPESVLSDDGICVRRGDDGFLLSATPFLQLPLSRERRAVLGRTHVPLAGLYVLEQGTEHRVRPLAGPQALGLILHNLIHFFRWFPDDACRAAFFTAQSLVREGDARTLVFARDPAFWDVVE